MVWLSDLEFIEEDLVERGVIILVGMHKHMFAGAIKLSDDATQSDYFRPRSQDGHYSHERTPLWCCTIKFPSSAELRPCALANSGAL